MKIIYKRFDRRFDTLAEAVEHLVDDAPDYYDGDVERQKAKIEKLKEIVMALVDQLNDNQQANLSAALYLERVGVK